VLRAAMIVALLTLGQAAAERGIDGTLGYQPARSVASRRLSFTFSGADSDDVLKFLADASGKKLYRAHEVRLKVGLRSGGAISLPDAIRRVQEYLSWRGFVLRDGRIVDRRNCLRSARAKEGAIALRLQVTQQLRGSAHRRRLLPRGVADGPGAVPACATPESPADAVEVP
jgi:hypothetical protein